MYLRRIYIENTGPLRKLSLELPFNANSEPKPIVFVGGNGSGKTNLLSIIADALFESAAVHFTDVVPNIGAASRPWFRISGASAISRGAAGSCSLLQFDNEGEIHTYKEKGGQLKAADVSARAPDSFKPHLGWADDGSVKEFGISDKQSKRVFESGVYLYLPSSRAESPNWLNRDSLPLEGVNAGVRISKKLGKPLYVERGLDQLKAWMLTLLVDIRVDFQMAFASAGPAVAKVVGDISGAIAHKAIWDALNQIIRSILNDPTAKFVWMGRGASGHIGFERKGLAFALPLDALSAGQATLLNIFGTVLRYGDGSVSGVFVPSQLTGICIVDEIDAHMHVDLQYRALPGLLRMFPKIQFCLSSHSPLFLIGMEKIFGESGLSIVDMPDGTNVRAETYIEFGKAFEVLQETHAFGQAMLAVTSIPGKLLVLGEGETDHVYLKTAAELLGRSALLELVEFSWVGAKDPKSGQGYHTGKDALNATANVLRAKPDLVKRPVLLLYDNDVEKKAEDFANAHIRSMPTNPKNTVVENGIENLLPESIITTDMFDEKTAKKKNGTVTSTKILNKMRLCNHVCQSKRGPLDFAEFGAVLDIVESLAALYNNQ